MGTNYLYEKNRINILFLLLIIFSSFSVTNARQLEINGDANSTTHFLKPHFNKPTIIRPDVAMAIIQSGGWITLSVSRLESLGYTNVSLIPFSSGLDILSNYDIVILPSTWAGSQSNADAILAKDSAYIEYVSNGGSLVVQQPNANIAQTINVTLLPEPVTFYYQYNNMDFPVIVDSTHSITAGLASEGMPFPADTISFLPEMYHVLVKGSISGSPSLFIAEYGMGKILVETLGLSSTSNYPVSDTVIVRMFDWLSNESASAVNTGTPGSPQQFYLFQNYPNPFNPSTQIIFDLAQAEIVTIEIFNNLGQKVATVLNNFMPAGNHHVEFHAETLPSGTYFYKIKAGTFQDVKKMILLK